MMQHFCTERWDLKFDTQCAHPKGKVAYMTHIHTLIGKTLVTRPKKKTQNRTAQLARAEKEKATDSQVGTTTPRKFKTNAEYARLAEQMDAIIRNG